MSGFYLPSENEFDVLMDDFVPKEVSKERKYLHFDLPLSAKDRQQNIDFSKEIKPHRFKPLLGFTDETTRFVKNDDGIRQRKSKPRDIRFASHRDAAYLEAYAKHLNSYYEAAIKADGISGAVLAYRRNGGTNIHHAKSLFDEIREKQDCTVVAMDISGFFDCLDHSLLRDEVAALLGVERLIGHHGTVWKNVTRYSWVETKDIEAILGKKRKRDGMICNATDFAKVVRGRRNGLVRTHDKSCGIPQGTPISGLYANIYLRTFDRAMFTLAKEFGGSYRRYSDDIALVVPTGTKASHLVQIVEKVLAEAQLAMSVGKTETAEFQFGKLTSPKPIQYLGFTFDGDAIKIRASSLDNFRRKMRHGIHAKLVAAKAKQISPGVIFKREALSRYTHLGKRRNFLQYAYKSADIMRSSDIKKQVSSHMTWFNRTWRSELLKVFGSLASTQQEPL